jgi:hypothetical protein
LLAAVELVRVAAELAVIVHRLELLGAALLLKVL